MLYLMLGYPVSYAMLLLLLIVMPAVPVLSSSQRITPDLPLQDYYRICPLPKCDTCVTAEQILTPGVGFALEMGYGTAAMRLHNGTYKTIACISGTPAYTSLLRRLASGTQNRMPHNIPSAKGKLLYLTWHVLRALKKLSGRPATPETAIIADMISILKAKTEAVLGDRQKVKAAVLSSPDWIRLTNQEITDVFDYLRIKNLMSEPDTLENLYATSSAYAGLGMGLCENYIDPYACEREEWYFPSQRLLHLDFTPDNLSGTIKTLQSARDGSMDDGFIDPALGLGRLHDLNQKHDLHLPEEKAYWAAVASRIRSLVQSFRRAYLPQITQIILTGSSALDPRFRAAVKDALRDLVAESALEKLDVESKIVGHDNTLDSVFATAKGAAEFAKRRQEGPVRCVEKDQCKRAREALEQGEIRAMAEL